MDLIGHFQMLARYNRMANERLFARCSELTDAERRMPRSGSFGSIAGLLNHMLLGDKIWMARFEGSDDGFTPALNTVLFADFEALGIARAEEDERVERYFAGLEASALQRVMRYINSQGKEYFEETPVAMSHFFNHQTHHRGQVHVMLSQTGATPPSLDLHRIINP